MTKIEFSSLLQGQTSFLKLSAMKFTKNIDDALDLVQDTLLKALGYHDNFEKGTNIKAWLYTMMRNIFINKYRKMLKVNNVVVQKEDLTSLMLFNSSTVNNAIGNLINKDIQLALSKIPEDCRIAFTKYVDGFKYHEIAEELNVPIGTIKTRIFMARQRLKDLLKVYAY